MSHSITDTLNFRHPPKTSGVTLVVMFIVPDHVQCYHGYSLSAQCMLELSEEGQFMYTTELENNASLCFRALEGSNYDVRCSVSSLLGSLMAKSQDPKLASKCKFLRHLFTLFWYRIKSKAATEEQNTKSL